MASHFSFLNGFVIFKLAIGDEGQKTQSIRISRIIGIVVTKEDKEERYHLSIDVAGHMGETGSTIEIGYVNLESVDLLFAKVK